MTFGVPKTDGVENLVEEETKFEVMEVPQIVIQRERGLELTSLFLKARYHDYGNNEGVTSEKIKDHFVQDEVQGQLRPGIEEIFARTNQFGVDQESLYILSLLYNRPDREQEILRVIAEHKQISPQEALTFWTQYKSVIDDVLESLKSTDAIQSFENDIEEDAKIRETKIEEIRSRIVAIIDFFKPDPRTTLTQTLVFTPTNPLLPSNSGRNFSIGSEQIIISHRENIENQDHEFMHGIINPIVAKVFVLLTDEQKRGILEKASSKLKDGYGEIPFSLLCEEIVRTYNDVFKHGKTPETYEEFFEKISQMSDEDFGRELARNKHLKNRCDQFGIVTRDDLLERAREYFDMFERNQLRELIFTLYEEYASGNNEGSKNFEQFLLGNLPNRL